MTADRQARVLDALTRFEQRCTEGKGPPEPKPKRRKASAGLSEYHEQARVCDWLKRHRVIYCHVPNGSQLHHHADRPDIAKAQLRRIGLKPGVPDLLIFSRPPYSPGAPGVALEMKRATGGRVSDTQRQWLDQLEALGWKAFVGRGADETIRKLKELGYGAATDGRQP